MHRIVAVSLLLALAAAAGRSGETNPPQPPAAKQQVKWQTSYGEAREKAAQEHGILMLLFVSDACPWCERLKQETLADPKVVQALSTIESVLMAPGNPEYEILAQRFGLRGVPHTAFLDEDGGVLGRVPGYVPPETFLERIAQARKAKEEHRQKLTAYQKNPELPSCAVELVESYMEREQLKDAKAVAQKAAGAIEKAKNLKPKERDLLRARLAFANGILAVDLEHDVDAGIASFENAERLASAHDAELASKALWVDAILHFQYNRLKNPETPAPPSLDDVRKSLALLEQLVQKYPKSGLAPRAREVAGSLRRKLQQVTAPSRPTPAGPPPGP